MDALSATIEDSASSSSAEASMLLVLVAIVLWSGHSLHHSRLTFLTEGSLALLWGLLAGGGFYFYFERIKGVHIPTTLVAFNYDIYVQLLLPPIIFYAGFSIKKKYFFANFGALTIFGVAGTILVAAILSAIFAVALHFLGLDAEHLVGNTIALGTVFASTDSVAALQALDPGMYPQLHALVFGEAVVNDATAIVLLRAVQHIRTEAQLTANALGAILSNFIKLSLLSMALGVGVGLVCSFILKHSFRKRHSTDHEVSLLAALGFLSYLLAEWLSLSGIFASFFCGLAMSHYAWHSLSPSAKIASIYAFRVLSFLAEMLMFLSCGLDLWSTKLWHKDLLTKKKTLHKMGALASWISIAVPLARFAVAMPLVALINIFRAEPSKISYRNAIALSWAGCARGVVTLALTVNHFLGSEGAEKGHEVKEESRIIAAAGMVAIVLSTVVLGGATPVIFSKLLSPLPRSAEEASTGAKPSQAAQGGAPLLSNTAELASNSHGARSGLLEPLMSDTALSQHAQHTGTQADASTRSVGRAGSFTFTPTMTMTDQQQNQVSGSKGSLHAKWSDLDKRVLQPLFGGRSLSLYRHSFRADSPPSSPRAAPTAAQHSEGQRRSAPSSAIRPSGDGYTSLEGLLGTSPFESLKYQRQHEQWQLQHRMQQQLPTRDEDLEAPQQQQQQQQCDADVLDELFTKPGNADVEDDVDREVEIEGLVDQAVSYLEN